MSRIPLQMDSPQLVISVVTYKPDFSVLRKTIESAQKSTLNSHIVIVDNGLEDRVQAFCSEMGIEYLRPKGNLGYGGGHNVAIKKYQDVSRYHLILNPDVTVHSRCFEELVNLMDQDPRIVLSTAKVLNSDGSLQRAHKLYPSLKVLFGRRFFSNFFYKQWPQDFDNYELKHIDLNQPLLVPSVSGCFMFFRTEALKKIGGFDERYFMYQEDIDLSRHANELGPVVYWPNAIITHDWARGSHRKFKLMWMGIVSAIKYFLKWGLDAESSVKPYQK